MAQRVPDTSRRWTIAELEHFPADGTRHELVDGVLLVTPMPRPVHEVTLVVLADLLWPVARSGGLVVSLRSGVQAGDHTSLEPDLVVSAIPTERPLPETWHTMPRPLLAVEVLSRGSAGFDRGLKRRAYLAAGVGEYWVLDPRRRTIERWIGADDAGTIHRDAITTTIGGAEFTLDVAGFWATVCGPAR